MSADPANFTPHVLDGEVDAIAVVGNRVVVGGQFTRAQNASGGPELSRVNIMAFNRTTGQIDTGFVPQVDGRVRTLVASPDGTSVYVGGQFNTVSGQPASKLMKLSVSTGQKVAGFNPGSVNALVYDAKLVGNRLFVAGQFTKIGNQTRSLLAELDPTTGALRATGLHTFAGTHNGGPTFVYKIDINDAGMLVAIGNFSSVNGLQRVQVAAFDASGPVTLMESWRSTRYEPLCYGSFEYYIRDVDFSPDGSYFVINTTGGYGSGPPTLCDSAARWTSSDRGQAVNPLWVNYNGGDSFYANALTGSAIYLGGHNRWQNNPYAADAAGPGAVERPGIGATDPTNGVPLSWNPGRTRGRGVFDMVATSDGLWVGSDTDRIGGYEYHGRIAFFPLAGGTAVTQPVPAALPVEAYTVGATSSRYLYRVNTGGTAVASIDAGPEWAVDTQDTPSPYRNGGSFAAGYAPVPAIDATVPAGTPSTIFDVERWDPSEGAEMAWDFPVPAGRQIEVRLYLANRCTCTQLAGQRKFDVALDGTTVLDDFDLITAAGHDTATMRAFTTTSDGNVDIDFGHVIENPLVNGIEILDLDAGPDPTSPVSFREFDGDDASASTEVAAGAVDWSAVRGGFALDGRLYLASTDGTFTVRSFDGATFGPATILPLYNLTQFQSEMAQMTSLGYVDGSIFFTLAGDANLYRRGFSVESGIVGALRTTVASGGIDWRQARGAFVAGDALYWSAAATGDLHRVGFTGTGQPGTEAPQVGTDTVVSGPSQDGRDWRGRAMFTRPGPPPNQAPVAAFSWSCTDLSCTFDASGSTDADGSISSYAWDFGDGVGSGVSPTHDFTTAGTRAVSLTVTDNDGATGAVVQDVTATVSAIAFVGTAQDQNGSSKKVHTVTVPAPVQAGDVLVLSLSINSAATTVTDPAGWTRADEASTSAMSTVLWTRTATAASAGSTVSVTTGVAVRDAFAVTAYRDAVVLPGQADVVGETVSRAGHTTPVRTAPAGSWVLSSWADKTGSTVSWTPPAGEAVRATGAGTGAGHLSWLMTDSGGALPAGQVGGLTATASSATAQATMATVVLAPAGGAPGGPVAGPVAGPAAVSR